MAKRHRGASRPRQPAARTAVPATARRTPAAKPPTSGSRRQPRSLFLALGGLVLLAGVAVVLGGEAAPSPTGSIAPTLPTATASLGGSQTAAATPIPCEPSERLAFHLHTYLRIRVGEQVHQPPANVGVTATCISWLHTHDASGLIHVEAPAFEDFTLGQFFDVWGEPLSTTAVGDHQIGGDQRLFVVVDGQRLDDIDPRSIVLRDREAIELQIGTEPLDPLPLPF